MWWGYTHVLGFCWREGIMCRPLTCVNTLRMCVLMLWMHLEKMRIWCYLSACCPCPKTNYYKSRRDEASKNWQRRHQPIFTPIFLLDKLPYVHVLSSKTCFEVKNVLWEDPLHLGVVGLAFACSWIRRRILKDFRIFVLRSTKKKEKRKRHPSPGQPFITVL